MFILHTPPQLCIVCMGAGLLRCNLGSVPRHDGDTQEPCVLTPAPTTRRQQEIIKHCNDDGVWPVWGCRSSSSSAAIHRYNY